MFIVTVEHNGTKWPLRGTNWAYSMDRAQLFADRAEAEFALNKARPFMKAAMFKKARVEQVDSVDDPARTDNV
jgi:hypothetical protein